MSRDIFAAMLLDVYGLLRGVAYMLGWGSHFLSSLIQILLGIYVVEWTPFCRARVGEGKPRFPYSNNKYILLCT
jgi:hypothetical protein